MAVGKLNPLRSTEPRHVDAAPAVSQPASAPKPNVARPAREAAAARALVATGDARNPLARGLTLPAQGTAMKDAQLTSVADPRAPGMVGHVADDPISRALAELEVRRSSAKKGRATAAPIFATTPGPVSAYLRSVRLNESFDWGLPRHVGPGATDWTGFKDGATNEVYVVTMAWDLSGREPIVFPPSKVDPSTLVRDMHKGDQLTFMGDGLALWPGTQVRGGLYTMVFVMESDSSVRALGDTIQKVTDAVQKSDLTKALAALAVAEPDAAALAQALQAINGIAGVVSTVLQQNSDDLVGVFYGTYGVDSLRSSRIEHYDDQGASIDLRIDAPQAPRAPTTGGKGGSKKYFE